RRAPVAGGPPVAAAGTPRSVPLSPGTFATVAASFDAAVKSASDLLAPLIDSEPVFGRRLYGCFGPVCLGDPFFGGRPTFRALVVDCCCCWPLVRPIPVQVLPSLSPSIGLMGARWNWSYSWPVDDETVGDSSLKSMALKYGSLLHSPPN